MSTKIPGVSSLVETVPNPSVAEVLAQLVPPREFSKAKFENYLPDSEHPSQSIALESARNFITPKSFGGFFSKSRASLPTGIYLDGGFGVGKTHLLASIWHAYRGPKAFGSFLAYTSLIGLLGFASALEELSRYELLCIDEFELDDPGDTMLMSRLLSELGSRGIRFATTSNTPPNALGQGRFAARDFAREISAMADRFQIVSVDGEDYRHRPIDGHAKPLSEVQFEKELSNAVLNQRAVACDDFGALLKHLSKVHPSKYLKLIDGIQILGISGAFVLTDQSDALRFVSFVDRLYESQVALLSTGIGLTEIFSADYLNGGYRKKYLRAISRIGSLCSIHDPSAA
ncbi:MAG: cell division protein ZapE [Actinomycetota bacterium]